MVIFRCFPGSHGTVTEQTFGIRAAALTLNCQEHSKLGPVCPERAWSVQRARSSAPKARSLVPVGYLAGG
jgi:hypothetical protein